MKNETAHHMNVGIWIQVLILGIGLTCGMVACSTGGNNNNNEGGVHITSIQTTSTNPLTNLNVTGFGSQVSLIVGIQDNNGSNTFVINSSSSQITGDQKVISNAVYEMQTRCEVAPGTQTNTLGLVNQGTCTGVDILLIARTGYMNPNSTFGSYFGSSQTVGDAQVTYQTNPAQYIYTNAAGQAGTTSTGGTNGIYSRLYLYRLNAVNNAWTLINYLEDPTGRVIVLDQTQMLGLETPQ